MKMSIIIVVLDICLFLSMLGSGLDIFSKINGFIMLALFFRALLKIPNLAKNCSFCLI